MSALEAKQFLDSCEIEIIARNAADTVFHVRFSHATISIPRSYFSILVFLAPIADSDQVIHATSKLIGNSTSHDQLSEALIELKFRRSIQNNEVSFLFLHKESDVQLRSTRSFGEPEVQYYVTHCDGRI